MRSKPPGPSRPAGQPAPTESSAPEFVDHKGEIYEIPHSSDPIGGSPLPESPATNPATADLAPKVGESGSKLGAKEEPESRMQRYLDFDPKLTGTSVGALLAVILGDAAERLGTTLDPLVAMAYAGSIIITVTWAVLKRR